MNRAVRLAVAAFWCAGAAWPVDWSSLQPQGYVSDYAGVLDAGGKRQLEAYCAAVEQTTGSRIALAIIPSLQGEPVNDVARALFRAWHLDQRQPQNGVLWLAAIENHRDAVEAGRGLSAILTDSAKAAILREARPALAKERYTQAATAAAQEIGARLAATQRKTIPAHLPGRAHRTFVDSIPWLLAAGAFLIFFWLFRLFARPVRTPRAAAGFGGGGEGGW